MMLSHAVAANRETTEMLRKWGNVVFSILTFLSTLAVSSPVAELSNSQVPLEIQDKKLQDYVLHLDYGDYTGVLDSENDVVLFSNIRYAAPPINESRWQKPQAPKSGMPLQGGTCPQACPDWVCKSPQYPIPGSPSINPQQEDCLFLDVYVPRSAINNTSIPPLPVVFWIYGGGFVFGFKDSYNGTALIKDSGNSIIFVAANYRLGAFGFLASSVLEAEGVPNAGFWDQRAALDWTSTNIPLLNGNPKAITVMGQSAGGGSIEHHLTAPVQPVFTQAILQSPAFFPQWDDSRLTIQFNAFASKAGCTGKDPVGCLRGLPENTLALANNATVESAPTGQFTYGPAVDNSFVPDLPGVQLKNKQFNTGINILVGHTYNEGWEFTPKITSTQEFDQWIEKTFSTAPNAFYTQVDSLYPPSPVPPRYQTEFYRLDEVISEAAVACNALYLDQAYGPDVTYNYYFSANSGYHGYDLCWTFPTFKLVVKISGVKVDLCLAIRVGQNPDLRRKYLVTFAQKSNPNYAGAPAIWNQFGAKGNALYMDIKDTMAMIVDDELPPDRCGFWQGAPYRS